MGHSNYGNRPMPLADRFWRHVSRGDGCWEWQGTKNRHGYGIIVASAPARRQQLAHRVSWELATGPIPDGLFVCHHCDNPPCCRPDHLYVGTLSDNAQDMWDRQRRVPTGLAQADAIYRLAVVEKRPRAEVAHALGIHKRTVYDVLARIRDHGHPRVPDELRET